MQLTKIDPTDDILLWNPAISPRQTGFAYIVQSFGIHKAIASPNALAVVWMVARVQFIAADAWIPPKD